MNFCYCADKICQIEGCKNLKNNNQSIELRILGIKKGIKIYYDSDTKITDKELIENERNKK